MQINRALGDADMDDLDHALGRPVNPMIEGSRNHFAIEADDEAALARFRASPHWTEGRTLYGLVHFHVTVDGRRALRAHLKETGQVPKLYEVTVFGHAETVAAKSRSAARYQRYLEADCGMSFFEFIRNASVKVA